MIIEMLISLKEVFEKGRAYPWIRPGKCMSCGSCRVWGHGFVPALFDGFAEALLLKRYRCPDCGAVFRCRPKDYFPRFQASVDTIRASMVSKSEKGKWLPGISKTRQGHWYRALLRHIAAHFGALWRDSIGDAFDALLVKGVIPVTRGI